jgi:3',5'-cyclic AMP phosphodiesterase CpdA
MRNFVRWLAGALRREGAWLRAHPIPTFLWVLAFALALLFALQERFASLPARYWNVAAVKRIEAIPVNDFTFSVIGDSKDDEEQFEVFLEDVARDKESAFLLTLGDMTSKGALDRYTSLITQLNGALRIPVAMCVGTHELTAHGEELYPKIVGPMYYSFRVGRTGFVVMDDVSKRGLDAAQLDWAAKTLESFRDLDNRLVFIHTPPYDPRGAAYNHGLHEEEAERLMAVLKAGKADGIFCSHIHGYFTGNWDGIPYWISGGAGSRLAGDDPTHYFFHYLRVTVKDGKFNVEMLRDKHDSEGIGSNRFAYEADRLVRKWYRFRRAELALYAGLIILAAMHIPLLFRKRVRQDNRIGAD